MDKCLDEIRTRVSDQNGGLPLQEIDRTEAFNAIYNGLPYVKAALSEGLRLHPSVPKNMKFAINDDVLPDGTKVKAGSAVIWSPFMMGRQGTIWKKPNEYIRECCWGGSRQGGSVSFPFHLCGTSFSPFLTQQRRPQPSAG